MYNTATSLSADEVYRKLWQDTWLLLLYATSTFTVLCFNWSYTTLFTRNKCLLRG